MRKKLNVNLLIMMAVGVIVVFAASNCEKEKAADTNNTELHNPLENPDDGPAAGNPDGNYSIPQEASTEDVSKPDHVVGNGTPESCTAEAFIKAVHEGGKITFNSGGKPVKITLSEPAKVYNRKGLKTVIDGGGLVTLSGGGTSRILYMNTCDEQQHWLTSHCQNQEFPQLTVQNITFADGNSTNETKPGGGAIWVRGGRFKAVNCRFFNNVCAKEGPDVGGGAIRVFSQYNGQPVFLTNCTFGGAEKYGNHGSNGGAISSIGVSWTIYNSLFSHNYCTGKGGNPAKEGTPGGGSGGAIYNDGNTMTLKIFGTIIEENTVNAYGAAIFFVSNNHTGNIVIDKSIIRKNHGGSWHTKPGISMHSDTPIEITNSTLE